jgi:disulfide oxidoreductase YuzD
MITDTHRFCLPRLHWLMAVLFLTMTGVLSFAPQPAQAAGNDKIEAFLSITGFDVAMDSIALTASNAPSMLGMPEDKFGGDWKRLAERVFDKQTMREMAVDILSATLSDEALDHAAAFYASELGQRLVVVENESQMLEDGEIRQETGQKIVDELKTENTARLDMLGRMNRAVHSAESSINALQEIQIRFLLAADAAGVIELGVGADGLRSMMQAQRGELLVELEKSALAGAAYVYRDFSDADIKTYTEALETPLMQEVYQLLNATQYEIMANRFEVLAMRMADLHPAQDI